MIAWAIAGLELKIELVEDIPSSSARLMRGVLALWVQSLRCVGLWKYGSSPCNLEVVCFIWQEREGQYYDSRMAGLPSTGGASSWDPTLQGLRLVGPVDTVAAF